jgi:hypothetical protein
VDVDEARLYGREVSSDGFSGNETDLCTPHAHRQRCGRSARAAKECGTSG